MGIEEEVVGEVYGLCVWSGGGGRTDPSDYAIECALVRAADYLDRWLW